MILDLFNTRLKMAEYSQWTSCHINRTPIYRIKEEMWKNLIKPQSLKRYGIRVPEEKKMAEK